MVKGSKMSPESKQKMRLARLGKTPWNKGKKTGIVPRTSFKAGRTPWNKGKKGFPAWNKGIEWYAMRGKNHPNWKGGKPKANRRETMSYEYYRQYLDWQKAVFKRDKWTCQDCGHHGGVLHAHHIQQWALYPELRFDVANGLTLCPKCHTKTDSYGKTKPVSADANVVVL